MSFKCLAVRESGGVLEVDVRNAPLITINIFLHKTSSRLLGRTTALTVSNQPLQSDVDIVLLFTADRVTADLTILKGEISSRELFRDIPPELRSSSFSLSDHSHPAHLGRWQWSACRGQGALYVPGKSLLFPSTSIGIPASWGLSSKLCSSLRLASILSGSAASTM